MHYIEKKIYRIFFIFFTLIFILLITKSYKVDATNNDLQNYTIILNTDYLQKPIVSSEPLLLVAEIRNSNNIKMYDKAVCFEIISGKINAEIKEGKFLYVKNAGEFTIRTMMVGNENIFLDYNTTSYVCNFYDINLLTKFDNITVYSQPIHLLSTIEIEGIDKVLQIHKKCVYSIISGNAEIFCEEFLKIKGEGNITIAVSSFYDRSVTNIVDFKVIDPDIDKTNMSLDEVINIKDKNGCSSSIIIKNFILIQIVICSFFLFILIKIKKIKKKKWKKNILA